MDSVLRRTHVLHKYRKKNIKLCDIKLKLLDNYNMYRKTVKIFREV